MVAGGYMGINMMSYKVSGISSITDSLSWSVDCLGGFGNKSVFILVGFSR